MFGIKTILSTLVLAAIPSSQDATLIFVTTSGCAPCRQVAPLVEELRREGYSVETVNAAQHTDIVRQLNVDRFPTFLMLSDDRVVDRVVGGGDPVIVRPRIMKMFDRALEIKRKNGGKPADFNSGSAAGPSPQWASPTAQTASAVSTNILPRSDMFSSITADSNESRSSALSAGESKQSDMSLELPQRDISPLITSSVKLRVDSPNAHSWGTGTIVDARNGEALIVTCGHIFRDSKGRQPIEVHLYGRQSTAKVPGRCIYYDLEIDVAFVAIKPPFPVRAVPIAPTAHQVRSGQQVWSVGCDGGANPTLRTHQVLSLDRIGTPRENALPFHYIQVSGAPVSGRSGGGLFTDEGYLVGVCNTGDPKENDGHFVPPQMIRQVLHQMKLDIVYENPSLTDQSLLAVNSLNDTGLGNHSAESRGLVEEISSVPGGELPNLASSQSISPQDRLPIRPVSFSSSSDRQSDPTQIPPSVEGMGMSRKEQATLEEIRRRAQDGDEVILIVRSRRNPEIPSDVVILNGTSDQFLRALAERSVSSEAPSYNPVILSSHEGDTSIQPLQHIDDAPTSSVLSGHQPVSFPVFYGALDR